MDSRQVKNVVIDLRNNGGGNSELIRPMLEGLSRRPQWKKHIYVLIGPKTFSSGVMNAIELKEKLGAILLGEPTGGKPNSYGEIEPLKLPNSGITVYYTSKYFRSSKGMDGDALFPDVSVPLTMNDLRVDVDRPLMTAASIQ
jgi:C-terminal processing protease CtpA/Prc